jgi:hypothetical protein
MHYTTARKKKKTGKPRVQTNEKRELLLASRQTTKSGKVRGSKGETILRRPAALLANG